jgi:hypothetical protein
MDKPRRRIGEGFLSEKGVVFVNGDLKPERLTTPELKKERQRKTYLKHRDYILMKAREYRATHPKRYDANYYAKNKERLCAKRRAKYAENIEKERQRQRDKWQKDLEHNRALKREATRRWREKKKNASHNTTNGIPTRIEVHHTEITSEHKKTKTSLPDKATDFL